MNHGYSRPLKFISILLLIAMLMTSQAFTVLAAEAADIIDEAFLARIRDEITQAREKAALGENTEEKCYVTPELNALLQRLGEYNSFTEEEKQQVRKLFGVDSVEIVSADRIEQQWTQTLDTMPASARYETQIARMQEQGKMYSALNESEKALILEYLNMEDADASLLFLALEEEGYELFQSMQIVQIAAGDLFTLDEALLLFNLHADRSTRDANIKAFKRFALAFDNSVNVFEEDDLTQDPDAEKRNKLRQEKAEYIDESALQNAKEMLFAGYSTRQIQAAYAVAATYGLNPTDLLSDTNNDTAVVITSEDEENFFNIYPVDQYAFESKVGEKARQNALLTAYNSDVLTVTVDETDIDYAVATAEVMETSTALYSTTSNSSGASFVKPTLDSGVQQPFNANITDREQVSMNTGALQYKETLVSVPGFNGNDMVLQITYDSSQSNLQDFDYTEVYDTFYSCYVLYDVYVETENYGTILYDSGYLYLGDVTAESDADSMWAFVPDDSDYVLSEPYVDAQERTITTTYDAYVVVDDATGEIIVEGSNDGTPPDEITFDHDIYSGTLSCTGASVVDMYTIDMGEDENGNSSTMYVTVWEYTYSGSVYAEISTGSITYTDIVTEPFEGVAYYDSTALQTHERERYDIGTGWSFNIPSIDHPSEGRESTSRVILPGVGTFAFLEAPGKSWHNTFEEYARDDMTLTDDSSYTAGQFPSDKKLTMANGTVYYFSEDGLLLAKLDRFGNAIRYRYTQVDGDYHPSEIIDTVGRSITFVYADIENGKTVTITAPDGGVTVLQTRYPDDSITYTEEVISVLDSIVYPDGERITFDYDFAYEGYSYVTDSFAPFTFALLDEVTYDTGMRLHYDYIKNSDYVGDGGAFQSYPVSKRYASTSNEDEITVEYLEYTYNGNYGACSVAEFIGEYYEYSTTVTEYSTTGTKAVKHTFNMWHECYMQETTVNGELYQKSVFEYDEYDLPCKTVTETYGTGTITVTELYTHDKYGNTLTYISPKGEGDEANTEYRTTYTYDATYQLPLTVEYKQNASTTVKLENVLTSDKKSIAETNTYVNDALSAKTAYTYDTAGRVLTETAYPDVDIDSGILKRYTYSGANLASNTVKNVTGNDDVTVDLTVSYTYDTMGRPITATDANGNSTTTTYDSRGRVTSVTAPDGSMVAYTYNRFDNRTSVASSGREPVVYNYDALGQLESVVYASGDLTVENFYDAHGRLVAETTNRESTAAGTTYYTYDAFDRITEKAVYDSANKLTYRETYAYDDAIDESTSLVTKTVHGDEHAADIVTKTYTNKYGEVVKENVGGVITQYEYDYVGNPIRVYYNKTTLATYTYDHAGNVLTETNPDGYTRSIAYDDLGRKLTESDFKGNITSYTYDNAGRLLTMTAPLTEAKNSVTKYYYDANGNIVKQQQSAEAESSSETVWRTVEQTYDSMNRVTDIISHVSDSSKQYTHYSYNLAGDLTDVYTGMTVPFAVANEDSYSHIAYTYDRRGNNTAITDALGQTESYTYDVLGMLTHVRQRNGLLNYFAYNASGNVTQDNIADLTAIAIASQKSTAYTLTGAVKSVTIDGETVEYTYDGMGNILTETEGNTVKTYAYDSRGRKSGYTLKINGQVISTATYAYDTSNRLTSVTEGGKTTTYTYDANGNRASQTTDGVTTTYTYNKANLVTGMVNKMGDVVISSFVYTYYADGNMHTKAETQLDVTTNTTYVYDGVGRLKSETKDDSTIAYYYDANGNRTLMNNDGVITSYTYDKNNRLLTEGDIVYTYDANGNTLTAGDKEYTYNYRGQQIGYSDGTTTATYAYNPSGLRSAKTVGGSTKYFVYNGMQIVFEYEDSVSDGTTYYYGLNRTHSSDGDVFVYNAHGDTVQLVNGGSLAASYTYDAFGNLTNTVGTSDNPFLYCSEYFDQETQTYYLRARYYNPANGRFTQQDAWGYMDGSNPLSLNLYTYCFSNPVAYKDFTGNWPTWGQIFTAAAIVTVGVVLAAATIASAGTVGAVAGAAAAVYFGASTTVATAVATTATVATVAVGIGVGATHLSDAGEALTGHNVIRDDLMGGNQQLYDDTRALLHIGSAGATYIGSTYGNSYSAPSSSNDSDRLNGTSASNVSASNNQKLDRIHLDDFVSDPTRLNKYSPEQIYSFLKNNGYEVSPLTQSATLKGLPFEQGGVFKVLWGGDKLLQYHPATGSHHGGAYYKVSSGTYGTTRIPIE